MSQEVVRRYQEFHSVVNCKNTEWLRGRRPKTERRKKPATSVAMTDFGGGQRAAGAIWRLRNGVEELGWRGGGALPRRGVLHFKYGTRAAPTLARLCGPC